MAETLQSNVNEARLLGDERFLRKVAFMYYDDELSQEAIAQKESCSRQTVSKALQKAKERGIIRVTITPDLRTGYLRNLSREVRVDLNIEDVVLVAGQNMTNLTAGMDTDSYQAVETEIATAAAEYLDQLLEDDDILAVSGGKTFMRNLVRFIAPRQFLPHMQVVPTIGFVEAHANFGDANMIAFDIATAYGANHMWFPCPALLKTREQVQQLRQMPIIKETYEMMERANVMITSLWTPHKNDDLVIRGILTRDQIKAIDACEPRADINHWIFDAKGQCINEQIEPTPYFLSGMNIPRLKDRIKKRNMKVILMAGGDPSYVPAIRSALRAGIANILITDHVTGQLLTVTE